MKNFFCKAFESFLTFIMIVAIMLIFYTFLKIIIEPLAPVITFIIILALTLYTFNRWMTAILSVGGILLYALSWPALNMWGVWHSTFICTSGILLWFMAVNRSFLNNFSMTKTT